MRSGWLLISSATPSATARAITASMSTSYASREPYAVDMDAVIATAVEQGIALEINSQPERMDLDGATAHKARQAGARFTISTDAHAVRQLGMGGFGIGTARRAWLGPEDVLNTMSLDKMLAHLAERRRRAEG